MPYLLKRLAESATTLLVVAFCVFGLVRLTGDPAQVLLPTDATPEQIAEMSARMGWDRPFLVQFWRYLEAAVQGDFGTSLRTGLPVTDLVVDRLGNSLLLTALAMAVAVLIGVPMGVQAALRPGSAADRTSMGFALLGQAVPSFWAGLIVVWIFGEKLGWISLVGAGDWLSYAFPAFLISWGVIAGIIRLLRSSMLDTAGSEYVKFARLKGVPERLVTWKHALRNAIIPVVTYVGLMFGITIANAIAVEVVFNWPGLGRLTYDAVLWRDFPLLQFAVLVWAAVVVAVSLAVDVVYRVIDPRIGA